MRSGCAGGADDLPERGVEPIGNRGTAVGDAADRAGVTAKADPARVDHQLGTGQSRGIGVAQQMGDELTHRLAAASSEASMLTAKAVTRPSVEPTGHPGQLGRGLGPTAASRGDGVGEGHQVHRAGGAGGVVGGRPGPSGVGMDVLDDPAVLGEHPLPPLRRGGRRRATGGRDDDGVDRPAGVDPAAQRVGGVAEAAGRPRGGGR